MGGPISFSRARRAKSHLILVAMACIGIALFPRSASAATISSYSVNSGAMNGTAQITLDAVAGTITIVLTDKVVDPNSIASNISAVKVNLSGAVTISAESNLAFTERDVASNGTYKDTPQPATNNISTTNPSDSGWVLQGTTATNIKTIDYDVLAGTDPVTKLKHGGPDGTIIGDPNATTGKYSGGGSIDGNGPHNPFIYQSLSVTFNVGSLAGISIASVYIQFGTTDNSFTQATQDVNPHTSPIPEPASLAVWGLLGMVGAGFARRRKAA
jgi:MYXO-CTERM domain-containing protein